MSELIAGVVERVLPYGGPRMGKTGLSADALARLAGAVRATPVRRRSPLADLPDADDDGTEGAR